MRRPKENVIKSDVFFNLKSFEIGTLNSYIDVRSHAKHSIAHSQYKCNHIYNCQ